MLLTKWALGSVSDALRNLIMHHADTRTFLKYYLDRRIDKNLPAIIRGLNPEDDIMRAACRMSRTIDPKRPQELTTAQSSSVNQQPEILALIRRRDGLRQQLGRPLSRHQGTAEYEEYRKLNQGLACARQRARDILLSQIQNAHDQEQPMLEVQRQLSGAKLAETMSEKLEHSEEVSWPQKRLIESLLTLPRSTLEEEMSRRTDAIDAVAAYCLFEEGDTCRLPRDKRSAGECIVAKPEHSTDEGSDNETPSFQADKLLESAIQSVMKDGPNRNGKRTKADERPRICFICLGQPNLDLNKRVQRFATHGDVSKHIKRKHLRHSAMDSSRTCNLGGLQFLEIMHLQRHAIDVHSTVT